jgi:hypothetical protein
VHRCSCLRIQTTDGLVDGNEFIKQRSDYELLEDSSPCCVGVNVIIGVISLVGPNDIFQR